MPPSRRAEKERENECSGRRVECCSWGFFYCSYGHPLNPVHPTINSQWMKIQSITSVCVCVCIHSAYVLVFTYKSEILHMKFASEISMWDFAPEIPHLRFSCEILHLRPWDFPVGFSPEISLWNFPLSYLPLRFPLRFPREIFPSDNCGLKAALPCGSLPPTACVVRRRLDAILAWREIFNH